MNQKTGLFQFSRPTAREHRAVFPCRSRKMTIHTDANNKERRETCRTRPPPRKFAVPSCIVLVACTIRPILLAGRPRTLARAWSCDPLRPLSSFLPDSKFQIFMLHHHTSPWLPHGGHRGCPCRNPRIDLLGLLDVASHCTTSRWHDLRVRFQSSVHYCDDEA